MQEFENGRNGRSSRVVSELFDPIRKAHFGFFENWVQQNRVGVYRDHNLVSGRLFGSLRHLQNQR